jgi:zinc protease
MLFVLALSGTARATLQLHNVQRYELDNGLTVLLLVDRNFPVASVQMLYKVGARNEVTGKTGLAHFLEHMAFRATENFPDTEVVSGIYARGGEWHGYTWTDQTTYYSTVPREDLGLLLAIEADRMARLEIDPAFIEAERGAVLSEMHMYENWPSSMLVDALLLTSFQAHPYRNNSIGWESDIEQVTHEDVVAFYREHYHPANGVLAVVGDFDPTEVATRIDELFGDLPERAATPPPHTIEPLQQGERRVSVTGSTPGKRFMMAWRAPAVAHPDFAAFLILQELLGGGSGVSFLQNDWGTPAREGSVLFGAANDVSTWFPPSEQAYVFVVGGSIDDMTDEHAAEAAIEERLARFMEKAPAQDAVAHAVATIRDELHLDVQTTEDAAHQLAFFEGIGALDVLLTLPARLQAVRPEDVVAAARRYLITERRSVAWYRPDVATYSEAANITVADFALPETGPVDKVPAGEPTVVQMSGGVPFVLQPSDLSPSVVLKILVPGNTLSDPGFAAESPGVLALTASGHAREFADLVADARAALEGAKHLEPSFPTSSTDPETRLNEEFAAVMSSWSPAAGSTAAPAVIAVAGDIDPDAAVGLLYETFGNLEVATLPKIERTALAGGRREVSVGVPLAQSQIGYIATAPGPRDEGWLAARVLLYIFAHHYEGRFGKEAISRRGLAYYVDARYSSNGGPAWVTLGVGVDTAKLGDLESLFREELQRLIDEPPTEAEVAEARQHFTGRAISAAQSNDELAAELAQHWLWHNSLPSVEALAADLAAVSRDDVLAAIPAFVNGLTITVSP